MVEWIIRLIQETGIVLGIMACVTGGTICAVKLAETIKKLAKGPPTTRF